MRPGRWAVFATALRGFAIASAVSLVLAQGRSPKLMVLLVVDQMRADYIDRFQQQWTGGLHRLVTEGAWFRQVDYPYFTTVTCAGHATISTGSLPSTHGMIQNRWWDRRRQADVACTDDAAAAPVSYGEPLGGRGESAAAMRVPALADELRAQLSPPSRAMAFSLKARTAVTLSGRRPDAVAWFDDSGTWVSSTAFSPKPIPVVADFVTHHPVSQDFEQTWERSLPTAAYLYDDPPPGVRVGKNMTNTFPHQLKDASPAADAGFYDRWQSSPFADEYLARMTLDIAERLHFDRGSSNLVAIGFSTLDRVGHDFGPHSHEVQDVLIRLDRTLDAFFRGIDRLVGAEHYTVALSADHGVAPILERSRGEGLDAGRLSTSAISGAIDRAFRATLNVDIAVARVVHTEVYLRPGLFDRLMASASATRGVRAALRALPGVLDVYTKDRIAANQFDDDPIGRRLAHSFDRERSGDLVVVLRPYWITDPSGTSHGTAYGYDTRVPILLMGNGIAKGEYRAPASPLDIAPTLAFLAGITLPRAQGRVLTEALR